MTVFWFIAVDTVAKFRFSTPSGFSLSVSLYQQATAVVFSFLLLTFSRCFEFMPRAMKSTHVEYYFYLYFIVLSCSSNIHSDLHEFQMHVCLVRLRISNRHRWFVASHNFTQNYFNPDNHSKFIIRPRGGSGLCNFVIFNSVQICFDQFGSIVVMLTAKWPKQTIWILNNDLLHRFIRKLIHHLRCAPQSEFQCQLKLSIWFLFTSFGEKKLSPVLNPKPIRKTKVFQGNRNNAGLIWLYHRKSPFEIARIKYTDEGKK